MIAVRIEIDPALLVDGSTAPFGLGPWLNHVDHNCDFAQSPPESLLCLPESSNSRPSPFFCGPHAEILWCIRAALDVGRRSAPPPGKPPSPHLAAMRTLIGEPRLLINRLAEPAPDPIVADCLPRRKARNQPAASMAMNAWAASTSSSACSSVSFLPLCASTL